jgi:hypothetical protein
MKVPAVFARRTTFSNVRFSPTCKEMGELPYASCSARPLKYRDINAFLLEMCRSNDSTDARTDDNNAFRGKSHDYKASKIVDGFRRALRIGQVCYSSIGRNYRGIETVHNISSLQVVNCVSTELQLQSLSALITLLVCLAYLQSAWVEPDGTMSSHYCVDS